MRGSYVTFGLLAAMAFVTAARAESPSDPSAPKLIVPPAADDTAFTCRDFRNRPVHTIEVHQLGDAGLAEYIAGQGPVIMVDPDLMATLPANLQLFFKLHECGHHVLGHLFAPTDKSEREADCWAIHEGIKRSAFTRDDVISWRPFFARSLGDPMGHLPGPQRIDFLLGCFEGS